MKGKRKFFACILAAALSIAGTVSALASVNYWSGTVTPLASDAQKGNAAIYRAINCRLVTKANTVDTVYKNYLIKVGSTNFGNFTADGVLRSKNYVLTTAGRRYFYVTNSSPTYYLTGASIEAQQ